VIAGSWWIDFTLPGDRRLRRRVGPVESLTVEEVQKVRAVSIGEAVKEGESIAPRDKRAISLSELKTRYLEALPPASRRLRKAKAYFRHLIAGLDGSTAVDHLSHVGLVSYRARRQKEPVQSSGRKHVTSASEVTRELSCLRAAMSWAERSGLPIGKVNVFRRLSRADRKGVFPPEPPSAPAVLSDEDVQAIVWQQHARVREFGIGGGAERGSAILG
jgi:hypothetical protein